jgi:hypothetical protein
MRIKIAGNIVNRETNVKTNNGNGILPIVVNPYTRFNFVFAPNYIIYNR